MLLNCHVVMITIESSMDKDILKSTIIIIKNKIFVIPCIIDLILWNWSILNANFLDHTCNQIIVFDQSK